MSPRELHPKLKERSNLVKAAWAHLRSTNPDFDKQPTKDRFRAVNAHLKNAEKKA